MPIIIDKEECEGCATCTSICPRSAIVLRDVGPSVIAEVIPELCDECCDCIESCLRAAIRKI